MICHLCPFRLAAESDMKAMAPVLHVAAAFEPPSAAADVLRAYLALHEGRVSQHWIYAAIGRLVAGDPEAAVVADMGWSRTATLNMAHTHVVALSAERDALRAKLERIEAIADGRHVADDCDPRERLERIGSVCRGTP